MSFVDILATYIGRTVEVVVPNTLVDGTLTSVQPSFLQVQVAPISYGGGQTVTVPLTNVDYVRVLV